MKIRSQMEAQRFLLQMVAKGFHWWVSGIEPDKEKLMKRHEKYAEHYGCDLSPAKKSYRKAQGFAKTQFIVASLPQDEFSGGYIWFLIATDGNGEIRENSKLKDARTNAGRITWNDYVMYEAPRHRLEGGGTRWSWYIKPQCQKELDHYVGVLLKQNPADLRGFFDIQCHRPMHHGIRHYLTRLIRRSHQNFTKMYPDKKWTARDPSKPLPIMSSYKSSSGVS